MEGVRSLEEVDMRMLILLMYTWMEDVHIFRTECM